MHHKRNETRKRFLVAVILTITAWRVEALIGLRPLLRRQRSFTTLLPHHRRLSIVIPAYNEANRILPTLETYRHYLLSTANNEQPCSNNTTLFVVDDGSTDETVRVVQSFAETVVSSANHASPTIHGLCLPRNQGKGAALSAAMEHLSQTCNANDWVLTADADGSADLESSLNNLCQQLPSLHLNEEVEEEEPILVCGYRTYADSATGRLLFRWGFRTTVRLVMGNLGTRDSQCGFKLMPLHVAQQLYQNLHLPGWSHDVEVLYRAKLLGMTVREAPVVWNDKDGSKLRDEGIVKVALRMFYDVCLCRLCYATGQWTV